MFADLKSAANDLREGVAGQIFPKNPGCPAVFRSKSFLSFQELMLKILCGNILKAGVVLSDCRNFGVGILLSYAV
jgi:hypothetical protein